MAGSQTLLSDVLLMPTGDRSAVTIAAFNVGLVLTVEPPADDLLQQAAQPLVAENWPIGVGRFLRAPICRTPAVVGAWFQSIAQTCKK